MRPLLLCFAAAFAPSAAAHDGPPYPILVDERVGEWTFSVWADPDVGTGTFFVYLEPPPGRGPDEVRLEIRSVDGRELVPDEVATSTLAEPGEPFQHVAEVEYAHRGTWPTTFTLRATDGRALGVRAYDLEVTPPGLGPFDLLWYAIPFVAIGAIWLRALLAQRAHDRGPAAPSLPPSPPA